MAIIHWTKRIESEILGRVVTEPWIRILELPEGVTHIDIRAEGEWVMDQRYFASCGPDGLAGIPFPVDRLVIPDCPLGALIGKIGGGSANFGAVVAATPAEGKPFVIGSHCIAAVPDKSLGPLFVGFNGLLRPVNLARLKITIASGVMSSTTTTTS